MDRISHYVIFTSRESKYLYDLLCKAANTSKDPHVTVMASRYAERIKEQIDKINASKNK